VSADVHASMAASSASLQRSIDMLIEDAARSPRARAAIARARAMIEHPRNTWVRFDEQRRAYTVTAPGAAAASTLTGATTQLARVFYPTLVRDDTGGVAPRKRASKRHRSCPVRGGQRHGSLVHAGVEHFVAELRARPHTVVAEMERRQWFDPCVRRFVRAFLRFGLLPVGAEVPVWDERLGVASQIDVVAVDVARGDVVVFIELKTGYEHAEYNAAALDSAAGAAARRGSNAPYNPEHWLAPPLHTVPSTPAHRHTLQLLLYDLMARAQYDARGADRLLIMQACSREGTVHTFLQPEWTRDRRVCDAVYQRLLQARRSGAALERRMLALPARDMPY
jgi:hypothetical protein